MLQNKSPISDIRLHAYQLVRPTNLQTSLDLPLAYSRRPPSELANMGIVSNHVKSAKISFGSSLSTNGSFIIASWFPQRIETADASGFTADFPAFFFPFPGTIFSWFAWHRYGSIQMTKHVSVWFGKSWSLYLSQMSEAVRFNCCFLGVRSCEGKDRDAPQWEQGSNCHDRTRNELYKHPWAEITNCYRQKKHSGSGKAPTSLTSRQDTNCDFSQLPPLLPDWHSCAELVLENEVSLLEPLTTKDGKDSSPSPNEPFDKTQLKGRSCHAFTEASALLGPSSSWEVRQDP